MKVIKSIFIFYLSVIVEFAIAEEETWTGRWLPEKSYQDSEAEKPSNSDHKDGRVPMGIANVDCDDAKRRIDVDWFDDVVNHTCFDRRDYYKPNFNQKPLIEIENIPAMYLADHSCMNETISYSRPIPTFGTHRPLWPKWGEYVFAPVQRWLHNLEHGGIVMLYHPCANKREVRMLKKLVSRCLYRHVITPYTEMSPERPLALVAWGVRLQMSAVAQDVVIDFIRKNALKGPEHTSKQGQYTHKLIKNADILTTVDDDELCPNY